MVRNRFPAAISPALFLSGCQLGAGEGGWPGNRGSDVYRLDRLVSRSRVCCRKGVGASIRVRMKAAALSPRRPVFLSLAAGEEEGRLFRIAKHSAYSDSWLILES